MQRLWSWAGGAHQPHAPIRPDADDAIARNGAVDGRDMESAFGSAQRGSLDTDRAGEPAWVSLNLPLGDETSGEASSRAPSRLKDATDGVFSNLSAKPQVAPAHADPLDPASLPGGELAAPPYFSTSPVLPPSYNEAVRTESAPSYFETVVVSRMSFNQEDELILEGMPVGSPLSFLLNLAVSYVFDIVGFLFCYIFSLTHSSREGARCGLGLTLLRHGILILSRLHSLPPAAPAAPQTGDDYPLFDGGDAELLRSNTALYQVVAYASLLLGAMVTVHSMMRYMRMYSLQRVAQSSSAAA